ncbi:hypothetical protein ABET15_06935 [Heyndrickxia faecalis]|uniref:hypothetical protein n=1 Tax=Heyndrickxia TaxID=2837504 RepID=UPI00215D5B3F|nr:MULTISPECIES: hypothetical protein [Heyndrickxia]MED4866718.1 hypothetical protein [Weizmannia sp. CD-2023]
MKKPFGLRDDVTVRSIAEKSNAYFFLIVFIAVLPAFLEGFNGNLFGFVSPYIVEKSDARPQHFCRLRRFVSPYIVEKCPRVCRFTWTFDYRKFHWSDIVQPCRRISVR